MANIEFEAIRVATDIVNSKEKQVIFVMLTLVMIMGNRDWGEYRKRGLQ